MAIREALFRIAKGALLDLVNTTPLPVTNLGFQLQRLVLLVSRSMQVR
jgi:hypothetical protein